jgi:hypothetical protein
MSANLKSPPEGLRNIQCEKGTLPVRPPILYVPLPDLHKKREMEQIKVKLPDGTKFQMPTYKQVTMRNILSTSLPSCI